LFFFLDIFFATQVFSKNNNGCFFTTVYEFKLILFGFSFALFHLHIIFVAFISLLISLFVALQDFFPLFFSLILLVFFFSTNKTQQKSTNVVVYPHVQPYRLSFFPRLTVEDACRFQS